MVSIYKWTPEQYVLAEQFFDVYDGVFRPSVGRQFSDGIEVVSVGLDGVLIAAVIAPNGSVRYFREGMPVPHVDRISMATMPKASKIYAQFMPEQDHELFAERYELSSQGAAEALLLHAPRMPLTRESWLYAARVHDRLREALSDAEYIVRMPLSFV